MNMFIFDEDMSTNVKYYPNVYTYKMLLEGCQCLCSAYYFTDQDNLAPYELTHANHPVCKWVRKSLSNWKYLRDLALCIYDEYLYRYDKPSHKSGDIVLGLLEPNLPDIGLTEFPQCFDDKYKCDNPVEGYRLYFNSTKTHLMKWKGREIPHWIKKSN